MISKYHIYIILFLKTIQLLSTTYFNNNKNNRDILIPTFRKQLKIKRSSKKEKGKYI